MLERNTFASIFEVTPIHDKKARAQSIMARIAMGMVYFPTHAPWWMQARQEMLQFPFGVHDDFVDALSWIGYGLNLHLPPKPVRKAKPEPQSGSLAWVKASVSAERKSKTAAGREGW
jgi:hypothetical protein